MARDGSGSSGVPIRLGPQRDLRKCGDEPIIGDPDPYFDVISVGEPTEYRSSTYVNRTSSPMATFPARSTSPCRSGLRQQ